jgi:hypothetical protein
MTMDIISATAEQHGFGSDPYKWVSGLTDDERAAVRAGKPVYFRSRPCADSPAGWRVAVYRDKRYLPRCPAGLGWSAVPEGN